MFFRAFSLKHKRTDLSFSIIDILMKIIPESFSISFFREFFSVCNPLCSSVRERLGDKHSTIRNGTYLYKNRLIEVLFRDMNSPIIPILFIFAEGVFGFETDGVKSVSVKEGDSVTLHTCLNQIQKFNKILWMFENAVIANIKDQKLSTEDGPDGRFRDRLELDFESGSLTIRNIRTNHSGLYQVDMFSTSKSSKRFNVTVTGVFDPDADKIKAVSVMEGDSVTLKTDVNLQKDDLMLWRFEKAAKGNPVHHNPCQSDATAIAKIYGETRQVSLDPGDSEIFNNRLKMDKLSGSLSITDVRPEHSGIYILQIIDNTGTKCRRFRITVSDVTKSHSHVVWMSIALALIGIMTVVCLAAGVLYRKDLLKTVCNCCQLKAQDPALLQQQPLVQVNANSEGPSTSHEPSTPEWADQVSSCIKPDPLPVEDTGSRELKSKA